MIIYYNLFNQILIISYRVCVYIPVVLFGLVFDIEFLILIMNFKSNLFCEVLLLTFEMWLNLRPLMGFSRKECTPPPFVEGIVFFKLISLDFQLILPWKSRNFPLFYIDPFWKSTFFLRIKAYPLEFQQLLHCPLEFSIDIVNRFITDIFLGQIKGFPLFSACSWNV